MLAADGTIRGWSLWAAIVILCREILVSGLREFLAEAQVGLPVSRLAKWKTAFQMVAIGFLIAGSAAPWWLYAEHVGYYGLWFAAGLTCVTGFDYLLVGLRHSASPHAGVERAPRRAAVPVAGTARTARGP
jgi:phosphatidylglycerophosphate synthase